MRKLFEKYMLVDGEVPHLVDPINFRGTWLPKLLNEGTRKLSDIFRNGDWYVAIGADEKADPRPSNDYIVSVEVSTFMFVNVFLFHKCFRFTSFLKQRTQRNHWMFRASTCRLSSPRK